jgi:hypothetical protein
MKKALFTFMLALGFASALAQAPQGFNYQAVARNTSGAALVSTAVGIQISILQGSPTGTAVYTETHSVMSNSLGLINLGVGMGSPVMGTFSSINWAAGPYFIEISMDASGGTTYTLMGTQQLMSVPYALYAENAGTAGPAGATGATGAMGATGATGATGAAGTTGATGMAGSTGATGANGVTGSTGTTGGTGPTGSTGTAGVTGATGAVGATGATGDKYSTTSTSSVLVGTGLKTFTVPAGMAYTLGQPLIILNSGGAFMIGAVTSYAGTSLTVNVGTVGGSGTFASWTINVSGVTGATGSTGAAGATGATGATPTFAVQFNLVNSGTSAWLFDNASDFVSGSNANPTITLYRGFTYKFNVAVNFHPFRIASSPGGAAFNTGVTNNDAMLSTVTFKVPMDAPSTLYYYCLAHPGTMTGVINIQ